MAKKKESDKDIKNVKVKSEVQELFDSFMRYFKLSNLLFSGNDYCPYSMNELKEDSEFYQQAKELCNEMEIDWEKMTPEQSNRVMLALLEDNYMAIKNGNQDVTIEVKVKPKRKRKEAADDDNDVKD